MFLGLVLQSKYQDRQLQICVHMHTDGAEPLLMNMALNKL